MLYIVSFSGAHQMYFWGDLGWFCYSAADSVLYPEWEAFIFGCDREAPFE